MFIELLIFLLYTSLFIFILYRIGFKKTFGLSFKESTLAFIIKLAAGCFYGYFFLHLSHSDKDTWLYHAEALKEYELLKINPLHFFINDIKPTGYKTSPLLTVFNSNGSFLKDLEITLMLKLFAVFDIFSGGRYYVNVIFYDAIVFFGSCLLFKLMVNKYPEKRKLWLLFIFYFPPLLFWTSGMRKDGLCFAFACAFIYYLYTLFEIRFSIRNMFYVLVWFVLLFLLRNYMALSFVPVITAYAISRKQKNHSLLIYTVIFICCVAGFFLTSFLPDSFDLPQKMAERQQSFLQLSGNSYMHINLLAANMSSYTNAFFSALNHVFMRPYFSEAQSVLYILYYCEIIFFLFLLFRIIFKPANNFKKNINDPLILSFVMMAFLNYLIIGYTVPFLGAIVRYKASFEIFFLLTFLCLQRTKFKFNFMNKKPFIKI